MKTFLPFFRKKRVQTVLAPFFKMIEAVFELLVPIFVAQIIDEGIPTGNGTFIATRCAVLVTLGIAGFAFCVVSQYMSATSATSFASSLRNAMYKKVNELSFADVDEEGAASVVTKMTGDVDRLQTGVNMGLRLLLRSPFIVFGAVIAAFTVDAIGASVVAAVVPLLVVIVVTILLAGIKLYRKSQSALETVTLLTRENVTGVRVLRAFGKEKEETAKFDRENDRLTKAQLVAGRCAAMMNPLTYAVINAGIVALLYVGAIRVNAGKLTSGQVVALYNYLTQILVELVKLANLVITLARAGASAKRIRSFLTKTPSQTFPSVSPKTSDETVLVRFDHVSMDYGGKNALEDVDFSLKKGETLGVIGGTGSGKSTLLQLVPRFYDVSKGSVFVYGNDVKRYPKSELREKIAVVMQKPYLSVDTLENNVVFSDTRDEERLSLALQAAQATDVVDSKKDGLQEIVLRSGSNFSGGQKQRISVARALYKDAEIILLDDVDSALDNLTAKRLRQSIRKTGKTTIVTSQRVGSVRHADKILVLDEGRQVGYGTHEELLSSCPLYRELYNLQFGKGGNV